MYAGWSLVFSLLKIIWLFSRFKRKLLNVPYLCAASSAVALICIKAFHMTIEIAVIVGEIYRLIDMGGTI